MGSLVKLSGVFFIVVMVFLIQPAIIYCLWDDVMVKFFDLRDVTFTDSIWISILANTLFELSTSSGKD